MEIQKNVLINMTFYYKIFYFQINIFIIIKIINSNLL